jgi:hypothetical protein
MNNELKSIYIQKMTVQLEYWHTHLNKLRSPEQRVMREIWDKQLLSLFTKLEQLKATGIEKFETLKFFLQTDYNAFTLSINDFAS